MRFEFGALAVALVEFELFVVEARLLALDEQIFHLGAQLGLVKKKSVASEGPIA
jgi:hypothetical protein